MTQDDIDRFWSKIDKSGECWVYTGTSRSRQYGVFLWKHDGKLYGRTAHRLAWELTKGPIPKGLHLCHDCPDGDNPLCCNPDHHFPGTPKENEQDKVKKGRNRAVTKPESYECMKRITDDQVREMRSLHASGGWSEATLAARYGISPALAGMIVRRKRRANVA